MNSDSVAVDLADALHGEAIRAGVGASQVRRADWRVAIVSTVGSDGTITTTDGIIARRRATYVSPVAGDQITITVSGAGSWIAEGRTAPATTAGTWVPLTFSGTWSAWGSPYYTPAYRINGDGTASLCGLAKAPASTSGISTIATLPTEARPASKCRFVTQMTASTTGSLDINTSGTVQIGDYSGTATWAVLDVARYRLY